MSFLKSLFRRKEEDDYETVLSKLDDDIRKRQIKLSEIRLRERRATLLATLYTLAAWGAYISLWYMKLLPHFHVERQRSVERAVKAVPVFLGPIIILFIRRIIQIWYQRKGDAEEKTLQDLMRKKRAVVQEIKKKTNFDSTQALLSRYDVTPASSPARLPPSPAAPSTPRRPQVTPQVVKTPAVPPVSQVLSATPSPFSSAPPRKQWYDKVADALLGDDDSAAGASMSRYALICENCFAHNGLVKESMWEDTQYVCPKCNHFNPSPRFKRSFIGASPQPQRPSLSPEPMRKSLSAGQKVEPQSPSSPTRPSGDTGMEVDS